eukprot:3159429-Pleurochrysis_carterae.AAC.1
MYKKIARSCTRSLASLRTLHGGGRLVNERSRRDHRRDYDSAMQRCGVIDANGLVLGQLGAASEIKRVICS